MKGKRYKALCPTCNTPVQQQVDTSYKCPKCVKIIRPEELVWKLMDPKKDN